MHIHVRETPSSIYDTQSDEVQLDANIPPLLPQSVVLCGYGVSRATVLSL